MSTFRLRSDVETGVAIAGFSERKLHPDVGPSQQLATVSTTNGGNHLVLQFGGTDTIWLYRVNAVTISGTISFAMWASESAMTVNAGLAVRISRYDGSGTFVSDVVANANAGHRDNVELGLVLAQVLWTATPTSTTFAAGDWLGVVVHADAVGTMAAGTVTLAFDEPGITEGDSVVTFTETITEYVAPTIPAKARTALQAVQRASSWFTRHDGLLTPRLT